MSLKNEPTPQRVARWAAVARESGIKLTHQRLEIFRELAANDAHPDAEALHRAVRERMPTVSLDTVYRTLWLLHELGLITTLGPRREAVRFDVNLEPHHHFVCTRCGLVRDFQSEELDHLRVPDAVKDMGGVLEARVEVRGVCARCQTQEGPSQTPGQQPDFDRSKLQ